MDVTLAILVSEGEPEVATVVAVQHVAHGEQHVVHVLVQPLPVVVLELCNGISGHLQQSEWSGCGEGKSTNEVCVHAPNLAHRVEEGQVTVVRDLHGWGSAANMHPEGMIPRDQTRVGGVIEVRMVAMVVGRLVTNCVSAAVAVQLVGM